MKLAEKLPQSHLDQGLMGCDLQEGAKKKANRKEKNKIYVSA